MNNNNKRKNSGTITTWLEKRSKPNINDPTPLALSSVTQVDSNEYASLKHVNVNEQPPKEPMYPISTTTIELSCDIGDYLER